MRLLIEMRMPSVPQTRRKCFTSRAAAYTGEISPVQLHSMREFQVTIRKEQTSG